MATTLQERVVETPVGEVRRPRVLPRHLVQVSPRVRVQALFLNYLMPLPLFAYLGLYMNGLLWVLLSIIAGPALCSISWPLVAVKMPRIAPAESDQLLVNDSHEETLCEVTITQNGVVTGVDRGVVLFEKDRILFNGHNCAFALAPQLLVNPKPRWTERLVRSPGVELHLKVAGQDASVCFWTMESEFDPTSEQQALDLAVKRSLTVGVVTEEEVCMPPLLSNPPRSPNGQSILVAALMQFPRAIVQFIFQAILGGIVVALMLLIAVLVGGPLR